MEEDALRGRHACAALLILSAVGTGGCGHEDPQQPPATLKVPESWAGVWEVTITSRECTTDSFLGVDVVVDTVCAGESVEEFIGLADQGLETMSCSGGFTDTHLATTCTGRSNIFCEFTVSGTFIADRADSTLTGDGVVHLRLVCSNEVQEDCIEAEIAGRRLAPAPSSCAPATLGLASHLLVRGRVDPPLERPQRD